MDDTQIRYLPFHAINEFMLDDYRLKVIQSVLRDVEKLPGERRGRLNGLIRRHINIPGFRNSAIAPLPLRVKGAVTAFERHPEFTAQVLQGWSELHPDLRARVFEMLKARNWEQLLPPEADRSKLPGFMTQWPKTETYEVLDQTYAEMFPDSPAESDDIRLMCVWIANRLPYELFEDEEEGAEEA
ncbi:MAG TPA: hypothetical protein DEQ80_09660 [Anaerolinea thermolimosa]|uniref:Uncharacterized protein n=1 Tax=Anaerolinea thermolimosa TaxID=229919 RepID=A0A3D1JHY1_9CHLR|nr:hypothetical protein [Anaerolinea thermolimosa]GAP07040.1 hypothetical protein ATHL_01906 [Anaerolinea thermolimosa]HCE18112.1 hypothetical protein [Anaerolinea thermolimosa]